MSFIECHRVTKSYRKGDSTITPLHELDLEVEQVLRQTLELRPVEEFAARLREWGQEFQADDLRRYGEELFEQASRFDLERLPKTLETFPALVDNLDARLQPPV